MWDEHGLELAEKRLTLLESMDCGPTLNTVKDLEIAIETLGPWKPKCVDPVYMETSPPCGP